MRTIINAGSIVPPPSARPPEVNLAPTDVEALADELVAYHAEFAPCFRRSEKRHLSPRPTPPLGAQVD
jgi:hypothetical protein